MGDTCSVTISEPGTLVGATVSALVYTTLITTGEFAASAAGTGIELTGSALAYGTELVAGSDSIAGTTIRTLSRTYSAIARPAIANGSRLGALGISLLAGTGAAVTTSALLYGGKQTGSYLYSCMEQAQRVWTNKIENYKTAIATRIQQPVETNNEILLIEDDIQIIECEKGIELTNTDIEKVD
jgi:hypothetical protein